MIEKRILWLTSVHHLNQFSQPVWCLRNEMLIKLSNCKVLSKLTANHLMAAILQKSKQFQTTMNFQTPSPLTKKGPFLHACTLLQNNISPWCLPQSVSLLDRVCTWQPSSVPQCNFCWYSMLYRKYYTEDKHLCQSYFQCRIRVYCFYPLKSRVTVRWPSIITFIVCIKWCTSLPTGNWHWRKTLPQH